MEGVCVFERGPCRRPCIYYVLLFGIIFGSCTTNSKALLAVMLVISLARRDDKKEPERENEIELGCVCVCVWVVYVANRRTLTITTTTKK